MTRPDRVPSRLRAGSRVALVAPSGVADPERVARGCGILRGWGLEVETAPHLLDRHGEFTYLAGPDSDRAKDLQAAWLDPGIDAVLCARGGYGAQRIADLLDWRAMAAAAAGLPAGVAPKVLAGFSDITALHEAFALRLGIATLHAPNVGTGSFIEDPPAQEGLRTALLGAAAPVAGSGAGPAGIPGSGAGPLRVPGSGAEPRVPGSGDKMPGVTGSAAGMAGFPGPAAGMAGFPGPAAGMAGLSGPAAGTPGSPARSDADRGGVVVGPSAECLVAGRVSGVTAGGNLSLLAANIGTPDSRAAGGFAGCILLLEDVNEPCYRLDRLLTQLLRSGALDGVAGIALGSWTDCGPLAEIRALMADRLRPLGVPVAWELGFGHCPAQPTIPLGVPATLDAGAGTLTVPDLPEPAVPDLPEPG